MKERLVLWVSKVILNLELHLKKVRLSSSEGVTRSEHIAISSTFVDSVLALSSNVVLLLLLFPGLPLLSSWNLAIFNFVTVALVFLGLALLGAWCDIVVVDSTNIAGFHNIVTLTLLLLFVLFVLLEFTKGGVVVIGGIDSVGMRHAAHVILTWNFGEFFLLLLFLELTLFFFGTLESFLSALLSLLSLIDFLRLSGPRITV